MTYKPDFVRKLRLFKTITMIILVVLMVSYLALIILNSELRQSIRQGGVFLAAFIITWLSLIIAFFILYTDFSLMKRNLDVAKDLEDLALLDQLTGLPNRYSIDRLSTKYTDNLQTLSPGCALIVIDNLKDVNEREGRENGDKLISDFCSILESVGRQYGLIGRNSGNEFIVMIDNCDKSTTDTFLEDFGRRIRNHNTIYSELPIELSYAIVTAKETGAEHFYELLSAVYRKYTDDPMMLR